jgi:hypothetical protein
VQVLIPADFPGRENISRYFVQRSADHLLLSSVLLTDEARFGKNGFINIHHQHQWAEENPQGQSIQHQHSSALMCDQGLLMIIR